MTRRFDNRVTQMMGSELPILGAPMGWIARAQLATAVCETGAMGMIETSSGELDVVRDEIHALRAATDRPFALNIAQAFVTDPHIVEFAVESGVSFVTTSAGSPTKYTAPLKDAGLTVFHVVPSLRAAVKAVEAGVDGLVVEGGEGGGFKNPRDVSTMVLLPLVRAEVDVPLIAAGGIVDGPSMAAAFALGAEGVQLGTALMSSAESPIHDNWKHAVTAAGDDATVMLNRRHSPALRALRTARTEALEWSEEHAMASFGDQDALYFGGDMEAAIPLTGQVAARIDEVRPVGTIIEECVAGFFATVDGLAETYPRR